MSVADSEAILAPLTGTDYCLFIHDFMVLSVLSFLDLRSAREVRVLDGRWRRLTAGFAGWSWRHLRRICLTIDSPIVFPELAVVSGDHLLVASRYKSTIYVLDLQNPASRSEIDLATDCGVYGLCMMKSHIVLLLVYQVVVIAGIDDATTLHRWDFAEFKGMMAALTIVQEHIVIVQDTVIYGFTKEGENVCTFSTQTELPCIWAVTVGDCVAVADTAKNSINILTLGGERCRQIPYSPVGEPLTGPAHWISFQYWADTDEVVVAGFQSGVTLGARKKIEHDFEYSVALAVADRGVLLADRNRHRLCLLSA